MFEEDFKKTFGVDKWGELQVVYHSNEAQPNDECAKVAFRLLEMIDFQCFQYGDNQGIDEEEAKAFLVRNRDEELEMEMPPTSYMGLMAGVFNFLREDPQSSVQSMRNGEK